MIQDVWKKFDEIELSHSAVHHLMAVYTLIKERGYARGIDVARYLDLTRGSVAITLNKLRDKGYLVEDENKFFQLSESGMTLINKVLIKRKVLQQFFEDVLKLEPNQAEAEACKVEHLVSRDMIARLMQLNQLLLARGGESVKILAGLEKFVESCNSQTDCRYCETECLYSGKSEK